MSQVKLLLTDTADFHSRHKAVTALVWMTACIAAAMLALPQHSPDMLGFVVLSTLMSGLALYILARYEKALNTRIAASDTGHVWHVQVNGVTVGEMKDADYAAIRRSVFFDWRLYVAQFSNFGTIALRMVDYLFAAIPITVFWLVMGCFFFVPDYFADALSAIQKVTPTQAVAAIPVLARLLIAVSVIALGAHLLAGRRVGFVNEFEQACGSRVRRALACAVDGEISLYNFDNGTFIVPDEMATIRTKR